MSFREVLSFKRGKEEAFQKFFFRQDIRTCRVTLTLVIAIMLVLDMIDYYRLNDFSWVLLARAIVIASLSVLFVITYQKWTTPRKIQFWIVLTKAITVSSFFFMDAKTEVPNFYLSNSLVIYFFISSTVSGVRFRYSSLFNMLVTICFLFYCQQSSHAEFQMSQIPTVIIGYSISLLISFMWESYKRLNFLHQDQLNNLISIFSHDLVSPLNSLIGLLRLHKNNLLSQSEFNTHVGLIEKAASSHVLLLQNLVKWSKSQMEGFKPSLESVDMGAIANEAITLLQGIADDKGVIFQNQVQPGSTCFADIEMAKLIVRNTLSNAIKFSYPKGVIEISSVREGEFIMLSIKDYGIGMTEEELKTLFSTQTRSKPGTSNEGGTGIGLYITRKFIKLNQGHIKVESESRKGSIVKIRLPIYNEKLF